MEPAADDLLRVNRLTLRLYAVMDPKEHIQAMLSVLNEAVGCDLAIWNVFNLATRVLTVINYPEPPADEGPDAVAAARYAHQSPFPAYYAASQDNTWRMISDFMPVEEFRKTDFATQGLRKWGPHQIACVLTDFNNEIRAITMNRCSEPFTERERAILNLLHPHLSLSHYNACAFERANQSLQQWQSVVEAAPSGYAYIGENGVIEWATAKARDLWRTFYAGEVTSALGVPTVVSGWIRRALSGESTEAIAGGVLQKRLDDEQLESRLIPAVLGGWVLALETTRLAPRPRFRPLPQLSTRQNDVLHWMTQGKRNQEIAQILGISTRTVEKHVEAIFEILGVENRATAIVNAMALSSQFSADT